MGKRNFGLFALVVGFLLIGFSAFAADGDLIVNGSVGIGTTSPSYLLHVASGGANANSILLIDHADDSSTKKPGITFRQARGTLAYPTAVQSGDQLFQIDLWGATGAWTYDNSMRQTILATAAETWTNSTGGWNVAFLTRPTGQSSLGAPSERMRIASSGNVGIGNTNPAHLLTMEAEGGSFYSVDGDYAHTWHESSSGRWKSDIKPIANPLDTVLKLNGVSFKWKKRTDAFETTTDGEQKYVSSTWEDDPNAKDTIGLIGEDVMKVLPGVVAVDKKDSNFAAGVAYSKIVPLLIEAIKEQQEAIRTSGLRWSC